MSKASSSDPLYSFPASQALQLVQLAARWGIDADALLGPFGLQLPALEAADARLPLSTIVELTERTRALTGEPGLGIYLGLDKHLSTYGFVGFAAMSAGTVGEALEQVVELSPSHTGAVTLTLRRAGDSAALVVHEQVDVGSIRDVAMLSLFVGLRQMTRDLTGRDPKNQIELALPEPAYFERFRDVLPDVRFGQPLNQLLMRRAALDLPLPRPNRAAMNAARQQCLSQLNALGFAGSLTGQVRRALVGLEQDPALHSINQVAAALGTSARTLKRRLAEQGSSFTLLRDEERQLRALHLLRSSELSVDEIAERVGYASASSFARAFTRWTGHSPAAYRRALPDDGMLMAQRRT